MWPMFVGFADQAHKLEMGLSDIGRLFRIADGVDPRRDSNDDREESRTLRAVTQIQLSGNATNQELARL